MAGKHQTKFRAGQTVWIPLWFNINIGHEKGCAIPIKVTNGLICTNEDGIVTHKGINDLNQMVKRRLTLSSSCSIYPSKRLAERYFKLRGVKVVNF